MKTTTAYSLLFCLCFASNVFAQMPKTDLQSDNIKGKVKTIKTTLYMADDVNGVPTKGKLQNYHIISYNAQGNATEAQYFSGKGTLNFKIVSKYNEKGIRTSQELYDERGTLMNKTICQNDAKGFLTIEQTYSNTGEATSKYTYQYDSKGNLTMQTGYKSPNDTDTQSTNQYSYDDAGYSVERISTAAYNTAEKQVSTYTNDANGNQIKEQLQQRDVNTNEATATKLYFYTYKLDTKGNWTSKTTYETAEKIVTDIAEREITYY